MKDEIFNRQASTNNRKAEPRQRTRKQGRKKKADKVEPQFARWDIDGRLICPHCKNKGLHRDGNYYADGSCPVLCRVCGERSVIHHKIEPL